jgi:hypothetical protein
MPIHAGGALEYALRVQHERLENPKIQELALDWLNSAKDFVVGYGQWRWLEGWNTISSTSTGILYFPDYVWEIVSFFPGDLGYRRPVDIVGGPLYDRAGPSNAAGISDFAVPWGRYGVELDNPSTGTLVCTSTGGAGDAGIEVTVEGETDTHTPLTETVTLNGAGTVTTAGLFRAGVNGVRRVSVGFDSRFLDSGVGKTLGTLNVTRAGITIESLDLKRSLVHEHLRYELNPTMTGSYTYRYYRRVQDIITLDHVLEVPNEFKDAYLEHLKGSIAEFQEGIAAGASYWAKANSMLQKLKWREVRQPGRVRGFYPSARYRRGLGWR